MIDKRRLERERLLRHEEWISRPVKELFATSIKAVQKVCAGCGVTFIWRPQASGGRPPAFCNTRCQKRAEKRRFKIKKEAPSSRSPPGAGGGLGDVPGEGSPVTRTRGAA